MHYRKKRRAHKRILFFYINFTAKYKKLVVFNIQSNNKLSKNYQ
jgi:hypothetical protein